MPIIRVSKDRENPYVMLNKTALNDPKLSYKAKGIFAYLMSKPDDWACQVQDLVNHGKDGRDSVYNGLKELRENGYLIKRAIKNEKGQIVEYEELLFEIPQEEAKKVFEEQEEVRKKAAIKRAETLKNKTENSEKATYGKSVYGKSVYGKPVGIIIKEEINKDIIINDDIERENACVRATLPVDNVDNVNNSLENFDKMINEEVEAFNKEFDRKVKELFKNKTGITLKKHELKVLVEMYQDDADYTIRKMDECKKRGGMSWSYFVSLHNTPSKY